MQAAAAAAHRLPLVQFWEQQPRHGQPARQGLGHLLLLPLRLEAAPPELLLPTRRPASEPTPCAQGRGGLLLRRRPEPLPAAGLLAPLTRGPRAPPPAAACRSARQVSVR